MADDLPCPYYPEPPSPPRPVPLRALGTGNLFLLLLGAIFGVVGLTLTVVFYFAFGVSFGPSPDSTLDERGAHATAVVTSVAGTSSYVNRQRIYRIGAHYTDAKGVEHSVDMVSHDAVIVSRAMDQKPISIDYDPESPTVARVHGGSVRAFGSSMGWVLIIPGTFALVGLVILSIGLMSGSRARRLYRDGSATVGRVTAVRWTSMSSNGRPVRRVVYEIRVGGRMVEGTWKTVEPPRDPNDPAVPPEERKVVTIWVIYDPNRPENSVGVPLSS